MDQHNINRYEVGLYYLHSALTGEKPCFQEGWLHIPNSVERVFPAPLEDKGSEGNPVVNEAINEKWFADMRAHISLSLVIVR